jgi:class 3 adenylate cyclase
VNSFSAADQISPEELQEQLDAEHAGDPFLLYRDGVGRQRILTLSAERTRLTIGRLPRNDVELGWDPKVSRVHAAFERLGATWTVEDEGLSTNGTFVNDQRLTARRSLRDGDVIRAGSTTLVFRIPAEGTQATHVERDLVVPLPAQRVLATVLFTDIVDSTRTAAELGDERWRELLEAHQLAVRAALGRFGGREVKSTGDGFLATFDGSARALRCARAIVESPEPVGIEVRAGLHAGECEVMGEDIGGIAVHIAARVSALAGPGQVLVSRTVKDLLAGSDIELRDAGVHELKGLAETWQLYALVA